MTPIIYYGLFSLVKVAYHLVEARRQRLAELLREHAYLPVSELCRRLQISESTARRDLAVLERTHQIRRTYGGALSDYNQGFASFEQRLQRAREAKQAIADQARALVQPGMRLYLDGGTTLHYVATTLAAPPSLELRIFTNNVRIADLLGEDPAFDITLIGGRYLQRQACCLGPFTERAVRKQSFDLAFLGAEAVSRDGVFNSVEAIAEVQRIAIDQAALAVLCADATKLGLDPLPPARVGDLADFHHLLSDASPERLAELNIAPHS